MHISDQIENELVSQGWNVRVRASHGDTLFTKRVEGAAEAGALSDGARVVSLSLDSGGRWFERHDGWGNIESQIDLRNYVDRPSAAISDVQL